MHYYIITVDFNPWMYVDMVVQAKYIIEKQGDTYSHVNQAISPVPEGHRYIFFGTKYNRGHVPNGSIITNFEYHLALFNIVTDEMIKTCEIWDYSSKNIKMIKDKFPEAQCKLFCMGYTPALNFGISHIESDKEIDVLLIGGNVPRRAIILSQISNKGYNVLDIYHTIDHTRSDYIRRSKICVSIYGSDERDTISCSRMAPILCSEGFIVAENCVTKELNDIWKQYTVSVDYDKLVETILYYITHVEERIELQHKHSESFKEMVPHIV